MHLVLDIGAQRHHGPLHGDVQQPRLQPDQKGGNQIQGQGQGQGAAYGAEVDALSGHHVHAGQQVGEGVVATGPCRLDGLLLGQTRRQLAADDAVEQQIGGMAQNPRSHNADRDTADTEQHHRDGQAALRGEPFEQPDRRALEIAGPNLRRFGQPHRPRQRSGHG